MDKKHKFIEKGIATDASVHGSRALDDLLDEKDEVQNLLADSAYSRKDQENAVKKYKVKNKIHENAYKNNPLTKEQKSLNYEKSKIRAE